MQIHCVNFYKGQSRCCILILIPSPPSELFSFLYPSLRAPEAAVLLCYHGAIRDWWQDLWVWHCLSFYRNAAQFVSFSLTVSTLHSHKQALRQGWAIMTSPEIFLNVQNVFVIEFNYMLVVSVLTLYLLFWSLRWEWGLLDPTGYFQHPTKARYRWRDPQAESQENVETPLQHNPQLHGLGKQPIVFLCPHCMYSTYIGVH